MSRTEQEFRPWVMPDSAYDADQNPAYFAIMRTSKEFHSMLRSRAELIKRSDTNLDLKHFDKAIKEVVSILSNRYRTKLDVALDMLAEFLLVLAGLVIAPLITELINWVSQNTQVNFQPNGISILMAIIGMLLIGIKLLLNYR